MNFVMWKQPKQGSSVWALPVLEQGCPWMLSRVLKWMLPLYYLAPAAFAYTFPTFDYVLLHLPGGKPGCYVLHALLSKEKELQ